MPAYRGMRVDIRKGELENHLVTVLEGSSTEKRQMAELLRGIRITRKPGSLITDEIDNNQTLLLFSQKEWAEGPRPKYGS